MSEFTYLTGRKELFDNAPPEAMVVLETNDGQIYYAVSHNRGAAYWYDNGNPGRPIGLIALFEKTRVVASRVRADGLPPAQPKRDPIPKSRLDRMEQAQKTLRKAVSQPAPVAPKPEPKPAPVKLETSVITPRVEPVKPKPEPAKPAAPAALKADGFVSIFAMSRTAATPGAFLNLHRNGNISLSTKLPLVTGDVVDVQVDPERGLIRVGKVETGGRGLPQSRMLTSKALVDTFRIPEGNNSIRIYLTEADGWWQGQAELVGVPK
jgi:hypothetical protein